MTEQWIKSAIDRLDMGTAEQKAVAALVQKALNDQTLIKVVTGVNSQSMTIVKLK